MVSPRQCFYLIAFYYRNDSVPVLTTTTLCRGEFDARGRMAVQESPRCWIKNGRHFFLSTRHKKILIFLGLRPRAATVSLDRIIVRRADRQSGRNRYQGVGSGSRHPRLLRSGRPGITPFLGSFRAGDVRSCFGDPLLGEVRVVRRASLCGRGTGAGIMSMIRGLLATAIAR